MTVDSPSGAITLSDNQPQHVARLSAEGHPNSHLMSSLADAVADDSINADCRQRQRYATEYAQQDQVEATARERDAQIFSHWLDCIDRQTLVDRSDRRSQPTGDGARV